MKLTSVEALGLFIFNEFDSYVFQIKRKNVVVDLETISAVDEKGLCKKELFVFLIQIKTANIRLKKTSQCLTR